MHAQQRQAQQHDGQDREFKDKALRGGHGLFPGSGCGLLNTELLKV
jgi:hypothetical protein